MEDAAPKDRRQVSARAGEKQLFKSGNLRNNLRGQHAHADAAGAEVQGARATVFGAGRIVTIAGRGRMRRVTLLNEMHGVLQQFTHARDERREKQSRDSHRSDPFHRGEA